MARYLVYFLLFCINAGLSSTRNSNTDTFEFGVNKGKVTFTVSGSIGILLKDKVTTIPIPVEKCSQITYIRVDVSNILGPPFVKFDEDINAIIIKYRTLQYSLSNYVVIVKTERGKCKQKKSKLSKKGHK